MSTELELFLWQTAFVLYVWLHLGAKVRRFMADWGINAVLANGPDEVGFKISP